MRQIGYVHIEEGSGDAEGLVYYAVEMSDPVKLDFALGYLPRYYMAFYLENTGVNLDAFCAALECF